MKRQFFIARFLLLGFALFILASCAPQTAQPAERESPDAPLTPPALGVGGSNEIVITANGFEPSTLTIQSGETVTWTNKDSQSHWPASAIHPTHTLYPGSGIEKCGTAEESTTFDACNLVAAGGQYSFTFTERGTWKYHDHLNPAKTGMIVVE
ncbi:MAG TPA: plastocyanin/azurin family copper-binding protein [Candidatus Nanoarchaeia archaeon]|nr:plastocyanin/azurin family copper-binding protein [Candidatus Nanoarchaeia archaeon]